jgi:dihydroflavonol-4-reductase
MRTDGHMKALVTGAAGFVGSHLVEMLVEKGWETTCFVLESDDLCWIRDLPSGEL